jgi:RNA polymerase sigma-70 factor (ECF subfamily)
MVARSSPVESMDELQVIRLAREGDQDAFEELVRLKRDKVYWVAYQVVGREEDARDISQMVFLRVWRSFDKYDEKYAFNTWLHTITVRMAIDFLRRQGRKQAITDEFDETLPGSRADGRASGLPDQDRGLQTGEIQRVFNKLARYLTERQRSIFILREFEGLSMKEIAGIVGCRESTVRNHMFQARAMLREKLKRHFPEYLPRESGQDGEGSTR